MRGQSGRVGGARGKSKMSRIWKLNIACEHLARRWRTSSTFTRVREVGQLGSDKKRSRVSDVAANSLTSYLHRSIANPATRKSTEFNLGLKELIKWNHRSRYSCWFLIGTTSSQQEININVLRPSQQSTYRKQVHLCVPIFYNWCKT